jgi:hypothetical protein
MTAQQINIFAKSVSRQIAKPVGGQRTRCKSCAVIVWLAEVIYRLTAKINGERKGQGRCAGDYPSGSPQH